MKLTEIIAGNYETIDQTKIESLYKKNNLTEKIITFLFEEKNKILNVNNLSKLNDELKIIIHPFIQDVTPEDITTISVCLAAFEDHPQFILVGFFLTALINEHNKYTKKDIEYKIMTNHVQKKLQGIGYQNRAHIYVCKNGGVNLGYLMHEGSIHGEGDCTDCVGVYMDGGTITINGSAKNYVGSSMNGGKITVWGNVDTHAGENMTDGVITIQGNANDLLAQHLNGGTIHVYGNAGKNIGKYMRNGIVYLHGTYEHISEDHIAGQIFHQGKRIRSTPKKSIEKARELVKRLNL